MWALLISLLNYFEFWVAIATSLIMAVSHYLARSLLFEETFSFGLCGRDVCQLISLLVLLHCVITWVAMKYIDKEVELIGKEMLLNNLEESVFVIDCDKKATCFQNKPAKKLYAKRKCAFWNDEIYSNMDNLFKIDDDKCDQAGQVIGRLSQRS